MRMALISARYIRSPSANFHIAITPIVKTAGLHGNMTDNTAESELKQRGAGNERQSEPASPTKSTEVAKVAEKVEGTWQTVKYYFNRFRYYHFVVADTIDKYLSAACLLIIKWYFKLFMGVHEPASALTEEE